MAVAPVDGCGGAEYLLNQLGRGQPVIACAAAGAAATTAAATTAARAAAVGEAAV